MGKKFKNWCAKPITRGDYLKWCALALGVSALEYGVLLGWWYRDKIGEKVTNVTNRLMRKEASKNVELELDD